MKPQLFLHFISLFPETIQSWLTTSILGNALKEGIFQFEIYQLRDFTKDKHHTVDDVAYGGGGGMVLKVEPLVDAVEAICAKVGADRKVIYFSPAGVALNHTLLELLKPEPEMTRHLILVCGHYEGVDQRFLDHWVDLEVSLGDFVLTGGELPALALSDALIRFLDGTLADETTSRNESFSLSDEGMPLLEYPHFTRPAEYRGLKVPEVLLSGHHGRISEWRKDQAIHRTRKRRPDLIND